MSDQTEYHLRIVDERDGMLWGEVVELPGCFASGADMDELLEAAAEAIVMYQMPAADPTPSASVLDLAKRRRSRAKAPQPDYAVNSASICIEA